MANVIIFGKQDWGPDELVAMSDVFRKHLRVQLLFEEPFHAWRDVLLEQLAIRSQAGEMFVQESVTYPLGELPSRDSRLVGATLTITLFDAEPVGSVKDSECFKALQEAIGFELEVIETDKP